MRKIVENAGKEGSVIIENVRTAQKNANDSKIGYNVLTDEYMNMLKGGVLDPAKVTRGALENAASIAAMILTTEALITDVPEPEKPAAPPMPEY
jgi:chaperonin GroEL